MKIRKELGDLPHRNTSTGPARSRPTRAALGGAPCPVCTGEDVLVEGGDALRLTAIEVVLRQSPAAPLGDAAASSRHRPIGAFLRKRERPAGCGAGSAPVAPGALATRLASGLTRRS